MKTILLTSFFLLTFTFSFAQNISIKEDLVYVDKQEFCGIIEEGNEIVPKFTLYNLQGEELFLVRLEKNIIKEKPGEEHEYYDFYILTNLQTDEKVELKPRDGFQKELLRDLYLSKVINENGAIVAANFQKFKQKYACKCSDELKRLTANKAKTPAPTWNAPLLERNRSAELKISAKEIHQDTKLIASYTSEEELNNGISQRRYQIYNHEGTLIASGVRKGNVGNSIVFYTAKENAKHSANFASATEEKIIEAMLHVLISKMYL